MLKALATLAILGTCAPGLAQDAKSFDAAAAFGARPSISDMSLSPDGQSVAYITPTDGQGAALYTLSLTKGASPSSHCVPPASPIASPTVRGHPTSGWCASCLPS